MDTLTLGGETPHRARWWQPTRPGKHVSVYELNSANQRGRVVSFRLPTGADQEAVLGMDTEFAVIALCARCREQDGTAQQSAEERERIVATVRKRLSTRQSEGAEMQGLRVTLGKNG